MFDLTNYVSFQEMEEWFDYFREYCYKSALVSHLAIIGTKSDLLAPKKTS
jgi:hypothetical protein